MLIRQFFSLVMSWHALKSSSFTFINSMSKKMLHREIKIKLKRETQIWRQKEIERAIIGKNAMNCWNDHVKKLLHFCVWK